MFHDKHRTTRHGTAHRDGGLTEAARPAVSGDDAEFLVGTGGDDGSPGRPTEASRTRSDSGKPE